MDQGSPALASILAFAESGVRRRSLIVAGTITLALALHAGVAFGFGRTSPQPAVVTEPTEIDFGPIDPPAPEPPPPPPPKEEALEEKKEPAPDVAKEKAPEVVAKAPPAAKAGKLLTAPDDAKPTKGDEPLSFVTDPNGTTYGSGVVATGGTGSGSTQCAMGGLWA